MLTEAAMKKTIKVKLVWDNSVWCSEVDEKDFCVTLESGSMDALIERVKIAVQDILEVDFKYTGDIEFLFYAERADIIKTRTVA
jgi:hypothetical protein